MTSRSFPLLRNAMYALRGGFLVRPLLISIALVMAVVFLFVRRAAPTIPQPAESRRPDRG